jgi:hypothetical protein
MHSSGQNGFLKQGKREITTSLAQASVVSWQKRRMLTIIATLSGVT